MGVDVSDGVIDGVVEGVEEVVAVGVCVIVGVYVAVSEGVGVDEINAVGVSDGVGSAVSLGVGDGLGVSFELDCNSFVRSGINRIRLLLAKAIPVVDKVVRQNRKSEPTCNRVRAGIFLFSRWFIFIPPNEPELCVTISGLDGLSTKYHPHCSKNQELEKVRSSWGIYGRAPPSILRFPEQLRGSRCS